MNLDSNQNTHKNQVRFWLLGALLIAVHFFGKLDRFDLLAYDAIAALTEREIDSNIVIVEIDSKSLQESGQWPWNREVYAEILRNLAQANVSSIFVDVDFSSKSNNASDQALAQAIADVSKRVKIRLPTFVQTESIFNKSLVLLTPIKSIAENAELVSVNLQPEDDGIVRKVRGGFRVGEVYYHSAWNSIAGKEPSTTYIDYSISPSSFTFLSFNDVLNNKTVANQLDGATVFIGSTAIELGDNVPVPNHKSLPGVVVQALAVESLLNGGLLSLSKTASVLFLIITAVIVNLIVLTSRWLIALFSVSGFILLGGFGTSYFYHQAGLLLPFVSFCLVSLVIFVVGLTSKLDISTMQHLFLRLSLSNRETLLNKVLATSNDGILQVDDKGFIINANQNCINIFACNSSKLIGKSIKQILPELTEEISSIENRVFEATAIDFQNNEIPIEISINSVSLADEKSYLLAMRNIKDRKLKEVALKNALTYDKLTGLLNRTTFFQEADRILSDKPKICLFKIDIDYFNEINEVYGHDFGDNILKSFTQRIKHRFDQEESILSRVGKDDFTVLREYIDVGEIRKIAEDLLLHLSKPFDLGGEELEVFCHIGIAVSNNSGEDIENLMRLSNMALNNAKSKGLEYDIITDEKAEDEPRHLAIISAIKSSLKKRDFALAFQPKINLNGEEIMGCEVLLRPPKYWSREFSVGRLIEVAESTRLIADLTLQVLDKLLDLEYDWQKKKLPRNIAVNLSLGLLANDLFMSRLLHRLDSSLGYFRFEFEITETARSENWEQTLSNVDKLIKREISLAIDDFGTGYSSLAYLRDLRASVLKIDRSFITDINDNLENQSIVNSTIKMAHELNMVVVAEGVETDQEKEYLIKTDCDIIQGYYYAKPMFFEQFSTWVHSHQSDNVLIMPQKS